MALTAIDVFAGAGGLTVGLKRAGFRVVAAVELEPHSFATYKANHPEVKCLKQDITTVSGAALLELAETERIDLLAGCPPCQGFTSLTAKYKDKEDPRNKLVLEMARLAEELRPQAIMMENVPGLTRKGKSLYRRLRSRLQALDYRLTEGFLQVADYGVPQRRRRLVLLGGLGFKVALPDPTHSRVQTDDLAPWRTVRETIEDLAAPLTLPEAKARGRVERSQWHVVRQLSSQNAKRIKAAKAGEVWTHIPEHLRPKCHREGYVGFTNVYGRMEWDRPSPTITGGCTTISKGRFGHPEADRTISVREAALLQTFPPDYLLDTPYMEHVCNMIGNALPCDFAEAVGRGCAEQLRKQAVETSPPPTKD
ncbi:MAG: DNA cytosine methyltransferase [Gammaproteobacteria bacterium]|nr:DNA cytosine methyltransferase [Gammaproteobacteria bacterium]